MTDKLAELVGNPGHILKAAREEQGLSLVQVAEALHLRGSVVDALEREDFSQFSSPIFLKGYFRSYCRLMKLHEERMLVLLEKHLDGYYGAIDDVKNAQVKAEQRQVRQRMLKKFALVLLLVLVPVTLWLFTTSGLDKPGDGVEQTASTVSVPVVPTQEPVEAESITVPEQEFSYSGETGQASAPAAAVSTVSGELAPVAEGEVAADVPITPVAAVATDTSVNPVADVASGAAIVDVPSTPQPALSDGTKALTFSFAGDCWLKLTDGKGKVMVAELKYSGDTFNVSAISPLTVILGDARVVTLSVDSQPFDLLKHTTQNGRAALVIK